ncbi:processed acidic surface protein [Salipaludibacillus sp. CF4.18]|uniref:processed acidic surface protein n=1 Tax=Salipaludibacillus sp. CF4.18 TaxID=3373081 RepID=UPI003EE77618
MKKVMVLFTIAALLLTLFPSAGFAEISDDKLEVYLTEIEWTKEELESYLSEEWDTSINDFETMKELKDFIGDLVNEDSLDYIYYEFDLTPETLETLLQENGKTLADFKFYDDLSIYLYDLTYEEEGWMEEDWEDDFDPTEFFEEFGLSESELWALSDHLDYVFEKNPNVINQLEKIYERLLAFEDFETATELTAEQIAEMFSIGQDMLSALEIKAEYFLTKAGEQKPITYSDLFTLTSLDGYDLLIVLYDFDGNKLADFIITGEMVNSQLVDEVSVDLEGISKEVVDKKESEEASKEKSETLRTVNGGKLPNTATPYPSYMLFGILVALGGTLMLRKVRAF